MIGIDPHKGSHTAAVIDRDEQLGGELSVTADRRHRDRLLRWAAPFEPRVWAIEGATGVGALSSSATSQYDVACFQVSSRSTTARTAFDGLAVRALRAQTAPTGVTQ